MPDARTLNIATGHLCSGKTTRIEMLSRRLLERPGAGLATFDLVWLDRVAAAPECPALRDRMLAALEAVARSTAIGENAGQAPRVADHAEAARICAEFGVPTEGPLPRAPDLSRGRDLLAAMIVRLYDLDIGLGECRWMAREEREWLLSMMQTQAPRRLILNVMKPPIAELKARCAARYPQYAFTEQELAEYYATTYPMPTADEGWDEVRVCTYATD